MKSLIMLLRCVLEDLGTRCGTSTIRDFKTVTDRIAHEGVSFLTITLTDFGKDLEKGLALGRVDPSMFVGFRRRGELPIFMGGFLDLVFDRGTGVILEEPLIDAIYSLRQFTLMCGKIESPTTPARTRKAIDAYLQTEVDVRAADQRLLSEPDRLESFSRIGRLLWAEFFSAVDTSVYNDSVVPKHGPGATADKLRGNAKYRQTRWTRRLEDVFPLRDHVVPNDSILERMDRVDILEPRDEIPVKVITVPKTLKTPRIIAEEPTAMQYMQQGILAVMMQQIPRFDQTRNLVCFERQEPNQRLALEGSITGALATLDLSEASDRVSNEHVRLLLANHRALREVVDATRSRKARVLDETGSPMGNPIRLAKFASMGSALTFPMEALVFATVIFMGIERETGKHLTKSAVKRFFGQVRVYGDDIIVPVDYVSAVIQELEAFGFKVNSHKSFWTGKFRESCGKDYYDGVDVSIARVRRFLPDRREHAEEIASAVSLRNQLFHLGFEKAVDFLDAGIRKLIPFPYVEWEKDPHGEVLQTSPLLGRHGYSGCEPDDHDSDYQLPLVNGAVLTSNPPVSQLDDYDALLKWFLSVERRKPDSFGFYAPLDEDHLQRAGRPKSVHIKTLLAAPF